MKQGRKAVRKLEGAMMVAAMTIEDEQSSDENVELHDDEDFGGTSEDEEEADAMLQEAEAESVAHAEAGAVQAVEAREQQAHTEEGASVSSRLGTRWTPKLVP